MTDPADDLPPPLRQAADQLRATVPDDESVQRALARARELEKIMFRRFLRRCAAGSAAAVLLLSAVAWLAWPRTTLAQVAEAIQKQPWIRARAAIPGGGNFESWMATGTGISAKKTTLPNGDIMALFDD